jgi:hypothetical protein
MYSLGFVNFSGGTLCVWLDSNGIPRILLLLHLSMLCSWGLEILCIWNLFFSIIFLIVTLFDQGNVQSKRIPTRPCSCRFWPRQRLGRQKRWTTQIPNPSNSGRALWLPSNSLDPFRLLVPLERADYCILLNLQSPHHFGFAIRFFENLSRISSQLGLFELVHSRITSLILISP